MAALALAGAPNASAATAPTAASPTSTVTACTPSSTPTSPPAPTSTLPPVATATSGGAGIGAAPVAPAAPPVSFAPPLPCPNPTVPGTTAEIIHGLAYAPADAPLQVQEAIWAGDRIRFKPYVYAGGHAKWNDVGYDCSGSVSYVLHAAGILKVSKDSSDFMIWGQRGLGQWITVYTNPGHAFVQIAGIRLDTSAEGDPHPARGSGPRWRPVMTSTAGFMPRHPAGL